MRPLPFLLRANFVCKLNYHLAGWLTVCLSVHPSVCGGVCVSEWVCVCVRECICCVGGRRVIHHQAALAPHRSSSRSKRCSSVKHKQLKRMLVNYSKTVMLPLLYMYIYILVKTERAQIEYRIGIGVNLNRNRS